MWIAMWYMEHIVVIGPQISSFTLLIFTSFLKLLSHICQRRFSPGNRKKATEVSFCNRPVHTQGKKLPLTSWCFSGCHIVLGKPSTLAPTYSTDFWSRAGTFSTAAGWCCFFLWLACEAAFWFKWGNKWIHCYDPSFSLGVQMLCPQGLSQAKSGSLFWGIPLLKVLAVTVKPEWRHSVKNTA